MKVKRMQELWGRCLVRKIVCEQYGGFDILLMIDWSEFDADQKGFANIWFEWIQFVDFIKSHFISLQFFDYCHSWNSAELHMRQVWNHNHPLRGMFFNAGQYIVLQCSAPKFNSLSYCTADQAAPYGMSLATSPSITICKDDWRKTYHGEDEDS